jgi:hypothetical protein
VIVDILRTEIERRGERYTKFSDRFAVITQMCDMPVNEVQTKAYELRALYANDLATTFGDECVHFQAHITRNIVSTKHKKTMPLDMCRILRNDDLVTFFPNVDITLRMYAYTHAANCTAER